MDYFTQLMQQVPGTTGAPETPEWTTRSRCLGRFDLIDDAMLPPCRERDLARRQLAVLCADCPVQALCLNAGLTSNGWGVWGGLILDRGKVKRLADDVTRRPRTRRATTAPAVATPPPATAA